MTRTASAILAMFYMEASLTCMILISSKLPKFGWVFNFWNCSSYICIFIPSKCDWLFIHLKYARYAWFNQPMNFILIIIRFDFRASVTFQNLWASYFFQDNSRLNFLKIFQQIWKSFKNLKIFQTPENLPNIWKSPKNLKIFQKSIWSNVSKVTSL